MSAVCLVHGIPDCSPMLNGCPLITDLDKVAVKVSPSPALQHQPTRSRTRPRHLPRPDHRQLGIPRQLRRQQ